MHTPLLIREPLAAATEAGHHFVADHHDAVAIAAIANALQVAIRRHENAVGADDRFEDDRGDVVPTLDHQHVVEMLRARARTSSASFALWNALRYVYGPQNLTTPGMPGSLAQRRGSPVRLIAPLVAPW